MHFEDESYTHHSLEVFTAEGRLSSHQGRDFYFNKSDNVLDLPGYRILNDQKIDMNSDMNKYQYNVILQLENYFKKSSFDLCSGKEALGNQLSMNKIIENI